MGRFSGQVRRLMVAAVVSGTLGGLCSRASGAPAGAAERQLDDLDPVGGFGGVEALTGRDPGEQSVYEVAAIAPDDAIAVGVGGDDHSVRARRWDGLAWRSIRPEGDRLSEMWGVGAISPTDVWGVGTAQRQSMAQHWDGTSWTPVPTPPRDPDTYLDNLESVDGARSRDVWAVGYTLVCLCAQERPLMTHWNGDSWTKVEVELPYGNTEGLLYGVSVISTDDAWAVGNTDSPRYAPLALHWDGQTWTSVELRPGDASTLRDVHAIATDDVWAVGSRATGVSLMHWDGTEWTRHRSPTGPRNWSVDALWSVHAIATDDVWAVGGYGTHVDYQRIRMLHWDGTRWSKVRAPHPGDRANQLWAVSGTRTDDVWAVGSYTDHGDTSDNLYLHWDGHKWSRARPGNPEHHRALEPQRPGVPN